MPTLINALNCKKYVYGTGLVPCEIRFRQPKTILRVDPSWSFDPETETFNLDYVISKIQDGTFTPFLNTLEFLNNTPDVTTKEYQGGAIFTIRNGKPQYSLEFDNGPAWHGAAYSYNGNRTNSVIIVDKVGNVGLLRNVAEDKLTAFLTNMFNTGTYIPEVGDETAKSILQFQIDNEEAFNTRFTVITPEEIGADLNEEIRGVVSVTIEGTAETGGDISISVNAVNNRIFGIQGLTEDNFRVRNADTGAVLTIDTVTAGTTPGTYTISTTASLTEGLNIIVETYDTTAAVATALVGTNQLYRGESAVITVGEPTT